MRTLYGRFERHVFARVDLGLPSGMADTGIDGHPVAPREVSFTSGGHHLRGWLHLPPGPGPFPCMLTNHGSGIEKGTLDVSRPGTAALLMSWGIASFLPHRRGYGASEGPAWREECSAEPGTPEYDAQLSARLDAESDDILAALDVVAALPEIDAGHIGVMGSSFGGTTTLLAAAKTNRFRCAIDFAGAAMNWEKAPGLREVMIAATRRLEMPVFFGQAANDYSIGPTQVLPGVAAAAGKVVASRIFPAFGVNPSEGHLLESRGAGGVGGRYPPLPGAASVTERFDVVVVGYGYAGGVAAIAAHDAGARVLLLEKGIAPGGISVTSAGGVRCTDELEAALAYLLATNGGTTPQPVLRALAEGMAEMPSFVGGLAKAVGAVAVTRTAGGNYPFPGSDSFGFVNVEEVPEFEPARDFPDVRGSPAGARLFKVVLENVRARGITVRMESAAERLVLQDGRVAGVRVAGETIAAGGVVLATGGFEGSPELQRQFWPMNPVLSAAVRSNTGDGLRMAQGAGAALWHMWHYHGSYGFAHPDPGYPFGIRLKRLPDWRADQGLREDVAMSWILVDRSGRRFMNEYEPYMQDTGHRALEGMDFTRVSTPRIPALLLVDADGLCALSALGADLA